MRSQLPPSCQINPCAGCWLRAASIPATLHYSLRLLCPARCALQDAWPLLVRLVRDGTCFVARPTLTQRPQQEPLAPAAVQRVRCAVMACLTAMASERSAAGSVQPLAWQLGCLAAQFLGASQLPVLREAATRLMLAAGALDPDAVWLLLVDLSGAEQGQAAVAAAGPAGPAARGIKPWAQILPSRARMSSSGSGAAGRAPEVAVQGGAFRVTGEVAADCAARAGQLLQQVEGLECGWHGAVAAALAPGC